MKSLLSFNRFKQSHSLLSLLLVILLAWLLAKFTWLLLTPSHLLEPPAPTPHSASKTLAPLDVRFLTEQTSVNSAKTLHSALASEQAIQGWQLLGTIITADHHLALVQTGGNGKLLWLTADQQLDNGLQVVAVSPQKVSIATRQGIRELTLSSATQSASSTALPISSLTRLHQQLKKNPMEAMNWLRLDPQWQNGQLKGVLVAPQKGQEALFSQLGFQKGDILLSLNGDSMQTWMGKLPQLPSVLEGKGAKARVLRQGKEQELTINW